MTDGPKKVYRGAGRVAFLARLDDFRKLIDAGHPLRAIYDDYAEQLGIGYPQFTKYVGRYVREKKDDGHQRNGGEQIAQPSPSLPLQEAQEDKPRRPQPRPKNPAQNAPDSSTTQIAETATT
ncbi:TraK family protein [Pseudomonas poae]|uniref:TraK family protein n=1 Tax=Pseudomonas poae TaxID=200451 RepID=UPI0030D2C655